MANIECFLHCFKHFMCIVAIFTTLWGSTVLNELKLITQILLVVWLSWLLCEHRTLIVQKSGGCMSNLEDSGAAMFEGASYSQFLDVLANKIKFSPWLCPPSFQSPDTLTLISLFSWTPGSFCLPRDHLDFAFFPLFPQQARHWVITETDCKPQHALEGRKCECGEEGHPHHDPALQGSPAGKTSLPTWGIWQVSFIDSSVRVQNRVTSHYL